MMMMLPVRWTSTVLRRSPRALNSCRWEALSTRSRPYTVSAPESVSESVVKLPELPSPEDFKGPLIESDFSQYLAPLYDRSWRLEIDRSYPEEKAYSTLRRNFTFPTIEGLIKFCQNTRHVAGATITICRKLETAIALPPPEGLTRSDIRAALETEKEYMNIVGADFSVLPLGREHPTRIESLKKMQRIQRRQKPSHDSPARIKKVVPIVPTSLPPLPPAPGSPPPALTDADLETYLKPLLASGWTIRGPRILLRSQETQEALLHHRCLHRLYHFFDYASARDFLHTALTLMPAPQAESLAGVDIRLRRQPTPGVYQILVWSISELAPEAPKKYGVSLADVRFAIELENEIYKNWLGRAQTSPHEPRLAVPDTLEDLYESRRKKVRKGSP
ncbi:hypothetical protein B0H11DRAFT_2072604 [Mycena galericulata]|nr:hypothetical protein B0H11DRAFT_2072604 [Mycena galericulata]